MARATGTKRRSTVPVRKVEGDRIIGRVLVGVGLLAAVVFAVQGGEYGTTDLIKQRRAIALERARVDSLERSVAELDRQKRLVESDPATQERLSSYVWADQRERLARLEAQGEATRATLDRIETRLEGM